MTEDIAAGYILQVRRIVASFGCSLLPLAATLCAGCGAGSAASPERTVESFANDLRLGQHESAYEHLSSAYRSRVTLEAFRAFVDENPAEAHELFVLLTHPSSGAEISAELEYAEGERLLLVMEDGEWRIVGNVVDFYDQSSPRAALRSFVRAMERRRYDVVMRFVPAADRPGMSEEQMRVAFEGEGQEEVERLLANLRASLDNPIEEVGDRATMPYGERFTVQFVREDGAWKVEDPD